MADLRVPRGFSRRHPAYQELMEGQRPTLKGLRAATYLPVAEIEARHDDPIVIPAGTWVGLWTATGVAFGTGTVTSGSLTGNASNAYSLLASAGYLALVPACSSAYKITYTSNDISTDFGTNGNVINLDLVSQGTAVTVAGTTTATVGAAGTGLGVKPVGIVYQDIYAGWLGTAYTNYDRQPNIGFLTAGQIIQVPVINSNERNIEPGDLVCVDGFDQTTTWDPTATPGVANCVGRLRALKDLTAPPAGSADANHVIQLRRMMEHVVGRCIRKVLIAYKRTVVTAGTKLATAISAGTITSINSINSEFRHAGRVQTVPGLGLQGSGTFGLGGHLLNARADSEGAFWALEILVGAA